jgi:hypothetical protein
MLAPVLMLAPVSVLALLLDQKQSCWVWGWVEERKVLELDDRQA